MDRMFIAKGEKVLYKSRASIIIQVLDVSIVSIEEIESGIIHTVNVGELKPFNKDIKLDNNINGLTDKEWIRAKERYKIIKPIIDNPKNISIVRGVSNDSGVSLSTLYRWVKLYKDSGLVSSLVGSRKRGGKGNSRLLKVQDEIIQDKIHSVYLSSSRKSITKTIREIEIACNDFSIEAPHPNTIRSRIKDISEEERIRKRYGYQEAKYKFEPIKGSFPGAGYPLSVVQIDHTLVDIILVDEHYRKPFMRPWLTLAIDVYSRMVVGFYLSFDSPGFFGTGVCIANSILPKEMWLSQLGIDAEWPCWGIMDSLHLDNAKEFKSEDLKRVCQNYGIKIDYRPVGAPHWGGHVERLLGTFAKEIHNLPGTTFSSVSERKKYQSEKNASFTLSEFERWITIFITKIYHTRIHSEIDTSPLERFKSGILGVSGDSGRSIPPRINNERKVRLDFMPSVSRTIQEYGIVIDHIYYYHDVLREYIHDSYNGEKKSHLFKRDPRDISVVYFFDPKREEYYEIPYRDTYLPPMSIGEYREVRRKLKKSDVKADEGSIFGAFKEMNEIEDKAIRETRKRKKKRSDQPKLDLDQSIPEPIYSEEIDEKDDVLPFEDIDDEVFK